MKTAVGLPDSGRSARQGRKRVAQECYRRTVEALDERLLLSCVGTLPPLPCYGTFAGVVAEFAEIPDGDNDTMQTQFELGFSEPQWLIRGVFVGTPSPGLSEYSFTGYSAEALSAHSFTVARLADPDSTALDSDYWRLRQPAHSEFELQITGEAIGSLVARLLDENGDPVSDFTPNDRGILTVEHEAGDVDQPLFVHVQQTQPLESEQASYELRLNATLSNPFQEQEPNGSSDLATPLQALSVAVTDFSYACAAHPDADVCRVWPVHELPTVLFAQGELEQPGQTPDDDFFSFSVPASHRIALSFVGEAMAAGVVPSLIKSDGTVVAVAELRDRWGDAAPDSATLEYSTSTGGEFFVQISSGDSPLREGAGDYELQVTLIPEPNVEHEPNDTPDQATPIVLRPVCDGTWSLCEVLAHQWEADHGLVTSAAGANGARLFVPGFNMPLRGSIEAQLGERARGVDDVDYFSFSSDARRKIVVSFVGLRTPLAQPLPVLRDADGTILATAESTDRDRDTWVQSARLEYFAKAADRFFIQVGPESVAGPTRLNYSITVDVFAEPHVEHEPNDTPEQADELQLISPYVCWADVCDDWIVPSWKYQHLSAVVFGDLDSRTRESDTDWFQFDVLSEREITVLFNGDAPKHGVLPELLDSDGNVLATATPVDFTGDGQTDYAQLHYLTEHGYPHFRRYFIRVADVEAPPPTFGSQYELRLGAIPDSSLEHEPNDDFLFANPVEVGAFIDGSVTVRFTRDRFCSRFTVPGTWCYTAERDVFVTTVREPGQLRFQVEGQLTETNGRLILFDGGQRELIRDEDASDGLRVEWNATEIGSFYAVVTHANEEPAVSGIGVCLWSEPPSCSTGVSYRLTVSAAPHAPIERPDEYEPNDSPETATPVVFESDGLIRFVRINGRNLAATGTTADLDYFRFHANAGSNMLFRFWGDAATDGADVDLLDSQGTVIAPGSVLQGRLGAVAVVEYFTWDEGDFYIRVGPASDADQNGSTQYHLEVHVQQFPNIEHEPNDSVAEANRVDLTPKLPGWDCEVCPPWDGSVIGHARGRLFNSGETADLDFFSFAAEADSKIRLVVEGKAVRAAGTFALVASDGTILAGAEARDYDGDGQPDWLELEYVTDSAADLFVRVGPYQSDGVSPFVAYVLSVEVVPEPRPNQGPDEHEPNDTLEQANAIELVSLPTFAPGLELRGGDVHGIAGGPTGDQDVFQFELHAGERVNVGAHSVVFVRGGGVFASIDEWLAASGLDSNGDPVSAGHAGPAPHANGRPVQPVVNVEDILAKHPDVFFGAVDFTVLDSARNELGSSSDDDGGPHRVAFDVAADGVYYAVVLAHEDARLPIHYRLGVLAETRTHDEPGEPLDPNNPTEPVEPLEIVLRPGRPFHFTDSDGDRVHIVYQGQGSAVVTFTGSEADGSDIESVEINGVRRSGNLRITSDGTAEVGSVEIHGVVAAGARARRRPVVTFGRVEIDGNLGSFASETNVRTLAVDGILGDLSAPGRAIGEVSAIVFDRATADVGSIRTLTVEEEMADALFERFLPWDDPARP